MTPKPLHTTPLKWPGGKYFGRHVIHRNFPRDIEYYCEPFLGGGHIFTWFDVRPRYCYLGDVDRELMAFWSAVQQCPDEFVAAVERLPEQVCADSFHHVRTSAPGDLPGQAARLLWLARMSWGAKRAHPNLSPRSYGAQRLPRRWRETIRYAHRMLHGLVLNHADFETLIGGAVPDCWFVYCDPPYYGMSQDGYAEPFGPGDHERLSGCLYNHHRRGGRFALTYNDHPEVRRLYEWARCIPITWHYAVDYSNGASKGRQLLIRNY